MRYLHPVTAATGADPVPGRPELPNPSYPEPGLLEGCSSVDAAELAEWTADLAGDLNRAVRPVLLTNPG